MYCNAVSWTNGWRSCNELCYVCVYRRNLQFWQLEKKRYGKLTVAFIDHSTTLVHGYVHPCPYGNDGEVIAKLAMCVWVVNFPRTKTDPFSITSQAVFEVYGNGVAITYRTAKFLSSFEQWSIIFIFWKIFFGTCIHFQLSFCHNQCLTASLLALVSTASLHTIQISNIRFCSFNDVKQSRSLLVPG